MDKRTIELLVCPLCKGPLRRFLAGTTPELVCRNDRLAFPIRDGVPMMLPDTARVLASDDPLLQR